MPCSNPVLSARARALALVLVGLALSGCGDDEEILAGERIPVRPSEATTTLASLPPLVLPPPATVSDWTHRNAAPNHVAPHAALAGTLRLAWRADAGRGISGRALLTASPIVADGRVYTLDAASEVRAFGTGGDRIWAQSLAPEGEDGRDGYGGGLAYAGGTLYVTTGFGEVLALDGASGEIRWRTRVDAPVRSAPTVIGGRVFAVTRDDQGFGLDARDGRVLWRVPGAAGQTGLLGGASPAADDIVAVLPFTSGEVTAVIAATGRRIWSAAITGGRRGLARANIGDITGDPVIDGETIYAANQSGRLVSIDRRTGARNWTANDGSYNAVWPAGGSVFLLSDTAVLLRLDAATGARLWAVQLPEYDDPDDREGAIGYGGPVLAGGRLILVSTEAEILSFNPENGAELGRVDLPGGSYLPPAVADGRLYVMNVRGELLAFQ
ncbi:MAG TPA: PQQ-binding-like beta-propeller repeat protein [Paracoccaceae bacterium]|nr:PQQ-binding-like beta-propeller repeat protein [Paracoccaceae bacterium]